MGDFHGARGLVLHRPLQREARRLDGNDSGALIRLKGVAELDETLHRKGRAGAVADGRTARCDLADDEAAYKAIVRGSQAIVLPGIGDQRITNLRAVAVGGEDEELAGLFHPRRATVEVLASKPP